MRNVDKIKILENQLELVNRENRKLREGKRADDQIASAVDAILVEIGIKYGKPVTEDGKQIGYRIEIPKPKTSVLADYFVKAEHRDDRLIIGVIRNEQV